MSAFTRTLIVDSDPNSQTPYHTIQSAATALASTGGTIIVEQGTYSISSVNDIVTIYSNTTIVGRGNVIINVTAAQPVFRNASYSSTNVSDSRIHIFGFQITIDMTAHTYSVASVVDMKNIKDSFFENINIKVTNNQSGTTNNAIMLENATNCKVTGCNVNGYNTGLHLKNANSNAIETNVALDCMVNCHLESSNFNTLFGNIFCGTAIVTNKSLYAVNSECNVYAGNQLNGSAGSGMYLTGSSLCPILGNIACQNTEEGILIHTENTTTPDCYHPILGNNCRNNTGNGILVEGNSYRNGLLANACINNSMNGIYLKNDNDPSHHPINSLAVGNVCLVPSLGSHIAVIIDDSRNLNTCNMTSPANYS